MCKYSSDLSIECGHFLCVLINSICPFSQCKHERWRPWQYGGRRTRANCNLTNDIQYIDFIILLYGVIWSKFWIASY